MALVWVLCPPGGTRWRSGTADWGENPRKLPISYNGLRWISAKTPDLVQRIEVKIRENFRSRTTDWGENPRKLPISYSGLRWKSAKTDASPSRILPNFSRMCHGKLCAGLWLKICIFGKSVPDWFQKNQQLVDFFDNENLWLDTTSASILLMTT
jgi:hypothetical protein